MIHYKSKTLNFFEKVYKVVEQIPYGKVTSYGSIADFLSTRSSARIVGWAMKASHIKNNFPAHRVVNRNGVLTGKNHFSYEFEMEERLVKEGILVEDNKIINFEKYFWNPMKELIHLQLFEN